MGRHFLPPIPDDEMAGAAHRRPGHLRHAAGEAIAERGDTVGKHFRPPSGSGSPSAHAVPPADVLAIITDAFEVRRPVAEAIEPAAERTRRRGLRWRSSSDVSAVSQ